jgi:hypothetical protein
MTNFRRITRPLGVLLAALVVATAAGTASAAPTMRVGFQDDVAFMFNDDHLLALDRAAKVNTTVIRVYVFWARMTPTRPANPSNPADPAYRFADLDAFVKGAKQRGIEPMLTIYGTPRWANGGQGENHLPRRLSDLTAFSRALAKRYSGTFAGLPRVQMYTVWNEPNLNQFLSPQFAGTRSVGPELYAKLYRAAYAGIKQGNPKALVAIGETSPRGRDKPGKQAQDSHSPGRFAKLLAQACDGSCRFQAYAHHPYSTSLRAKVNQRVRWPNVNLPMLPRFERSLERWFGLNAPPRIWITEYGYQTNPPRGDGVSPRQQAQYLSEAIGIARRDPLVDAFVWFIFHDVPGAPTTAWESSGGLYDHAAKPKPALARFAAIASTLGPRR